MDLKEVVFCPYCQEIMDIDSRIVSQETILRNPKTSCIIQASCMQCLIQVTINGNLRNSDKFFQDQIQQNKILLLQEMINFIPKENRPAFVTARKKEVDEKIKQLKKNPDINKQEIEKITNILSFLNEYIEQEPWGDYS